MEKAYPILLFVFITTFSFGQKIQHDTLFLANKKFLLEKSDKSPSAPYDFPFAIAECQYKDPLYSEYYYVAQDICGCQGQESFFSSGNSVLTFGCKDFRTKSYRLYNFTDSITTELKKIRDSKIFVKQGLTTYYIEKIQFKIIYDSTIAIINPDLNQKNDNFYWQLEEAIDKTKPKFIILNEMMYTDKKNKLQHIPRQFIIRLK